MGEEIKKPIKSLLISAISISVIMGIFVILVSLGIRAIFFDKITDQDQNGITKKVECLNNLKGFQDLPQNQIVELINKKISTYAAGGKFVNPTVVIAKRGGIKSEVACGYVHIKTGTGKGYLREWENIYIKPYLFGGHIITDNALLNISSSSFTELLLPLDNIKYREDRDSKEIKNANWAALLNVSDKVEFGISLNSEDPGGFIEDMSIGYKCINIETGKETSDCRLDVIGKSGF